jgi:hypothetical protein
VGIRAEGWGNRGLEEVRICDLNKEANDDEEEEEEDEEEEGVVVLAICELNGGKFLTVNTR